MECMTFDELKEKEVINMNDCSRLGFISDITIDVTCGKVVSFTVRDCSGFVPHKGKEVCVPWEKVTKIGCDIIFVDICVPENVAPVPKDGKKRLFG